MAEAQNQGTGPAPPPQQQRRPETLRPVVVEIDDRKNNNLLFNPTQDRLRGRWDWSNLPRGESSERGLTQFPVIPGMRIRVEPQQRRAFIEDPLADDDARQTLAEVKSAHLKVFGTDCVPVEPRAYKEMDQNALATWLYWLNRYKEAGQLRVLEGKVPTLAEIAQAIPEGKIRRQFYDSLAYRSSGQHDQVSTGQLAAEAGG